MSTDPLLPHFLDIASDPASDGLILAGGFGLRLKQAHLRQTGARTLMPSYPEARATRDIDFFLSLSLFLLPEKGAAVRALLDRLGYAEHTPQYQFGKPLAADPGAGEARIKVDLLARLPVAGESVRVKPPRVGSEAGVGLHGRETPEAFAVEDSPVCFPMRGRRSDGTEVEAEVAVPHPYAWLNLKVKAAHDWLRRSRGEIKPKPYSERHVFDVYLLVAMLTEGELSEAANLAAKYAGEPTSRENRQYAAELFGTPEAPGSTELQRQLGPGVDHALLWEVLQSALGSRG